MATYQYRCQHHGDFDATRPMGTAPAAVGCPDCGEPARRSYTAPLLRQTTQAVSDALSVEERSRHEPEVVNAVPPPRRASAARDSDAHPPQTRLPRG